MRTSALVVAGLVLLTLTGCQTDDPIVVPQPEPSSTPLFASEEEALAAAEEAYAGYLAASDAVLADGGADPERVAATTTERYAAEEQATYESFSQRGWHTTGKTTVEGAQLQQVFEEDGVVSIVIYVCANISDIRILDSTGVDVTPPDRATTLPLEVELQTEPFADELRVERSDSWSGAEFCA